MDRQEKLTMHTPNLADDNFAALAAMFPNAMTETITGHDENGEPIIERAIDADVLAQEINTHVVSGKDERYQFTWPEKKKTMLLANAPIAATLRPCKEESVDFDNTENLYIEGDNLDVLKLLRETYLNRVKMIYIDPPYNTGNDFIYEDDFTENTGEFLRRDNQYDGIGNRLTSNFDTNGRFHTDWLNMIYPRLKLAKDLLAEDGVIFISIDDYEIENLTKVCNEIYGESNMAGIVHRRKNRKPHNAGNTMSVSYEFILIYYKNISFKLVQDYAEMKKDEKGNYAIYPVIKADKMIRTYTIKAGTKCEMDEIFQGVYKAGRNANLDIEYLDSTKVLNGRTCEDVRLAARYCLTDENGKFSEAMNNDNIFININGFPKEKRYRTEEDYKVDNHHWDIEGGKNEDGDEEIKKLFNLKGVNYIFSYPKPVALLKKALSTIKEKDFYVLDFFSGSASTAHAVMQLNAEDGGNRKFIMVQLPEEIDEKSEAYKTGYKNICEIGKERIRRAGSNIKGAAGSTAQTLDTGFRVLKLDSSNMKEVYYTPEEYSQMGFNLDGFMDNIKPNRSAEDLLFQVMLDLGIPLSAKIEQDGEIFNVNDNYLIACFGIVDTTMITEIAQKQPYYSVFRDSSFANDSALVNVEQVFNTYSPSTIRRVL